MPVLISADRLPNRYRLLLQGNSTTKLLKFLIPYLFDQREIFTLAACAKVIEVLSGLFVHPGLVELNACISIGLWDLRCAATELALYVLRLGALCKSGACKSNQCNK